MPRKPSRPSTLPLTLRKRAEAALRQSPKDIARMSEGQMQKLVHELQVHQIELEMQNEELRHAQAELAQSRDRFNDLYDFAPVGYLTLDERAVVLEANLTLAAMLGVERHSLVGAPFTRFVVREAQDTLYLHQQAVLHSERKHTCELVLRRTDRRRFPVLLESICIQDPTARARRCRTVISDISERKRVEEALACSHVELERRVVERTAELSAANDSLRASEARLRTTLDNMLEGCQIIGFDWKYLYLNATASRHARRTPAELLGRTMMEVYPGITQTAIFQTLRDCMQERASCSLENEFTYPDGSKAQFEIGIRPVPEGLLVLSYDITARKQAERDLARYAKDVAAKNKELETVVYVVSHDLRSPLVNVQGFSKELARHCQQMQEKIAAAKDGRVPVEELAAALQEEIPRALHFIGSGVARIDTLLAGFLRYSRIGRAALRIHPLDMGQVLAGAIEAMRFQIEQAGAEVELGPLPGCLGDATQVGQVFSNLLDNALKYRDPNRPLRVTVTGRVEADHAIYAVADNGIGISPDHQARIFEMFHRLDPGATPGEGLGLTIAQRILDRQQGRISVESACGKESTFFVSLPAVPSPVSNA